MNWLQAVKHLQECVRILAETSKAFPDTDLIAVYDATNK